MGLIQSEIFFSSLQYHMILYSMGCGCNTMKIWYGYVSSLLYLSRGSMSQQRGEYESVRHRKWFRCKANILGTGLGGSIPFSTTFTRTRHPLTYYGTRRAVLCSFLRIHLGVSGTEGEMKSAVSTYSPGIEDLARLADVGAAGWILVG